MAGALDAVRSAPLKFFALVFALSVPIWVIGAAADVELLPGLPVSSLMAFCPFVAAWILLREEGGSDVMTTWIRRCIDPRIGPAAWYLPTLLLMPGIAALAYGLMRLIHRTLPYPQFRWATLPVMLVGFLVAAMGEELGWSGYLIERLQERSSALRASLLLGSVWAIWHIVPFAQVGRSAQWIAWQSMNMVAMRVLLVWLYQNTGGNVMAVAISHATSNLAWQLFPNGGSHYDPRMIGLIAVLAAVLVTLVWGPRTLSRPGSGDSQAA